MSRPAGYAADALIAALALPASHVVAFTCMRSEAMQEVDDVEVLTRIAAAMQARVDAARAAPAG